MGPGTEGQHQGGRRHSSRECAQRGPCVSSRQGVKGEARSGSGQEVRAGAAPRDVVTEALRVGRVWSEPGASCWLELRGGLPASP